MKFIHYLNEATNNLKITSIRTIGDSFIINYQAKMYGDVETNDRIVVHGITELLEKLENWGIDPKDVPYGSLLTLQDYLNDLSKNDNIIKDLVTKNCQPILKELKGGGKLIVRGKGSGYGINGIKEVTPRQDRRPLSTNATLSAAVDKALHKRFGWYPRSNGVFTYYGDNDLANAYGKVYYMLPIGEYKYVWSQKYEDLYLYLAPRDFKLTPMYIAEHLIPNITRGHSPEIMAMLGLEPSKALPYKASRDDMFKLAELPMKKLIDVCAEYAAKQYTDKNLKENDRCEVTFKCDSYYLIERNYQSILMEMI
jgi:hypothetical protein